MLEQENPLPGAELELAALDRDRQLGRGQSRAQMRRHVVRSLVVMLVPGAFVRDAREISFEVAANRRSGVLLDHQRGRSMPAEQGRQPFRDAAQADDRGDVAGDFVKPGATRANRQSVAGLAQHYTRASSLEGAPPAHPRSAQNKSAHRAAGAFNALN